MARKYDKEYSLTSITIKVPKDCGTGLSFWINQQVSSVVDNFSVRWYQNPYTYKQFPNKKLSDAVNGNLEVETKLEWVDVDCGHRTLQKKETGFLILKYSFSDCFVLTDFDRYQYGQTHFRYYGGFEILNDYAKQITDALSASGVHTIVRVDLEKHYVRRGEVKEFCSYCSSDRKHKVHKQVIHAGRAGSNGWDWGSSEYFGENVINAPQEQISQAA